ncbi:hypothetical protein PIB30_076742 [Stylosanthes scabra]|uniref:Putative plant transposon protein domain-containing protein n=1 Tax=Stylosanthes scabra TaxID=79078 RepID=A0ABU6QQ25_9FABA|nr:hypothetical protein [Stylosanthes scabra]
MAASSSSSLSSRRNVLDELLFRTLFNQHLYEETVCRKKITPEVEFNLRDEEYPEIRQHISRRGWRRLASPISKIAKAMIQEFYANVTRSEEEMEGLKRHPYTSYARGVQIDFSPANIRRTNDQQLDAVLRDLCIPGATWKMGTGRPPRLIQLRRPELLPLVRGWQEFIIHNLIPTGNKSEISTVRAVLIHSIIQGDDIRAEELIDDNIVLIAQGLGGKENLGFPSTIYKLCKDAEVRMREYRNLEQVSEGRYIIAEVMETVRVPRVVVQQNQLEEEEEN